METEDIVEAWRRKEIAKLHLPARLPGGDQLSMKQELADPAS